MTFDVAACLIRKSKEGQITQSRADAAAKRYRELREATDDALAAGDQLVVEQLDTLRRKQWTKLNQVRRQAEAIQRIDRHEDQSSSRIARSFFEFLAGQQIGGVNVAREFQAVRKNAHALTADAIQRFAPTALGRERRGDAETVLEENIIRELFGQNTGNKEAQDLAKGIGEGMEYLRTEFNRVGGNVNKREDFGLPQQHDPRKVEQVSEDEWVDTIMPMLDREKVVDEATGQPFSDAALRKQLQETYRTIVSRGLEDMDPTNPRFGEKLTTRHQHRRFLQFRSPDDWLEYQRQFGPGNGQVVFSFGRYIDTMSRDIAAMRVLGPSPQQTVQLIAETLKARKGGKDEGPLMQMLLAETTGKTNAPVNEQAAGIGIGIRNVLNSAMLGQAFFSALTDVGFQQTAARYAGLPQFRTFAQQLKLLDPTDGAQRRQAVRLGLGAQGALETAQAAARVSGESLGDPGTFAGATRRVNDFIMRASLLQPWTEASQWAFGTEMLATLTEQADMGRSLDQLPDALRSTFARNGVTSEMWDAIRTSERFTDPETGGDFIRPIEVMGKDREAANALQRMISAETEFAVPSHFASARSALTQGTRSGTVGGEILRSVGMLKNFPVTVMMLQWGRIMQQTSGVNKLKYASGLIATTGALGVVGEQLSSVADGKKPRPMFGEEGTTELMLDGLWRAGTFGLMGDVVFTNFDKFGSSLGESLAGPALGVASDAQGLVFGNAIRALGEPRDPGESVFEQTDLGRDALNFAQQITPGNTLWWSKLATQRLFWDQLQTAADPEYANSFRRTEQIAEDQGTEFFFAPQPLLGQ